MPLKRGPNGSLGVQMYGGNGGGGGVGSVNMTFKSDYHLNGAVSSEDIARLTRKSSEDTENRVRRSIPSIISQYNRDGTIT